MTLLTPDQASAIASLAHGRRATCLDIDSRPDAATVTVTLYLEDGTHTTHTVSCAGTVRDVDPAPVA